jgi:hypothetical protein
MVKEAGELELEDGLPEGKLQEPYYDRWWGHSHAGHTDAMVFPKLQFVPNSVATSLSDSADTSSLFRS